MQGEGFRAKLWAGQGDLVFTSLPVAAVVELSLVLDLG